MSLVDKIMALNALFSEFDDMQQQQQQEQQQQITDERDENPQLSEYDNNIHFIAEHMTEDMLKDVCKKLNFRIHRANHDPSGADSSSARNTPDPVDEDLAAIVQIQTDETSSANHLASPGEENDLSNKFNRLALAPSGSAQSWHGDAPPIRTRPFRFDTAHAAKSIATYPTATKHTPLLNNNTQTHTSSLGSSNEVPNAKHSFVPIQNFILSTRDLDNTEHISDRAETPEILRQVARGETGTVNHAQATQAARLYANQIREQLLTFANRQSTKPKPVQAATQTTFTYNNPLPPSTSIQHFDANIIPASVPILNSNPPLAHPNIQTLQATSNTVQHQPIHTNAHPQITNALQQQPAHTNTYSQQPPQNIHAQSNLQMLSYNNHNNMPKQEAPYSYNNERIKTARFPQSQLTNTYGNDFICFNNVNDSEEAEPPRMRIRTMVSETKLGFYQRLNLIPRFDGTPDRLIPFCSAVRKMLTQFGAEGEEFLRDYLPEKFSGPLAGDLTMAISRCHSVEQFLSRLELSCNNLASADTILAQIRSISQFPNESASMYGTRVSRLIDRALAIYQASAELSPGDRSYLMRTS